jgi:hypothetical protein
LERKHTWTEEFGGQEPTIPVRSETHEGTEQFGIFGVCWKVGDEKHIEIGGPVLVSGYPAIRISYNPASKSEIRQQLEDILIRGL